MIETIRERHSPTKGFDGPSGFCLCGDDWPCDAAKLLELLTIGRLAAAWHWWKHPARDPGGRFDTCEHEATALLASLIRETP